MSLILGSHSPRRKEILQFFSIPFTQIASEFDESTVPFSGDPRDYVKTLSQKKAETLHIDYADRTILTADTVVFCDGKIYNKPESKEEATQFLQELSNRWHSVFTAITLYHKQKIDTEVEETQILFHPLTTDQIHKYLKHVNYLDKAGSYAIQQGGSILIDRMQGCYYNVMGLPIGSLKRLLLLADIDLWDYLKIL